jgi:hypothetical protein
VKTVYLHKQFLIAPIVLMEICQNSNSKRKYNQ